MNILEYIARPQFNAVEIFFGAMAGRSAIDKDWFAAVVFFVGGGILSGAFRRYTGGKS